MSPVSRRRDYAEEYARRKARAHRRGATVYSRRVERAGDLGLSRSQAAGHPREGEPSARQVTGRGFGVATFFDAETRSVITLDDATAAEMRRSGRVMQLARQLRDGRITPAEYRRRTSRAEIRGHRVLSDPAAALALAAITDRDEIVFRYLRGRAA